MAVHLVLRVPAAVPAAQLRLHWQGVAPGDGVLAQWLDGAGRLHRWAGEAGVRWLQRDQFAAGEQWKINLDGVPADVAAVTLVATVTRSGTVGLGVSPLADDTHAAVLHPGAGLEAGVPTRVAEFTRSSGGWTLTPLNSPIAPAAASPIPGEPSPPADVESLSWSSRPAGALTSPTSGPTAGAVAPQAHQGASWTPPASTVRIPDRLTGAVDAARSTGQVTRTTVEAVVDLSASMRPWLVTGAVPDIVTAVQAVAGAASSPTVGVRLHPSDTRVRLDLDTDPAALIRDHLQTAGLRTGDRSWLLRSLPGPGQAPSDRVTVLVTDDPSLASATSAVTVLVGDAPVTGPETVVAVGTAAIDIDRLAAALAERCFTTPRR